MAPCDLNLYILLVFIDLMQTKNDNYQPQDEKIYIYIHLPTTTTKHLSWKTLKPKCDDKKYKKNSNFKTWKWNRLKLKWKIS